MWTEGFVVSRETLLISNSYFLISVWDIIFFPFSPIMMTDKYIIHWNTLIRPSRKSYESKKKTRTHKKADAQNNVKHRKRFTDEEKRKFEEIYQKEKNSDGTVDITIFYKEFNNHSHNTIKHYYDNTYNPEYDVKYGFVVLYFILVGIEKMN